MKKADSRRNAPYVIARHYPLSVIASKRGSACVAIHKLKSTIKPFRRDLGAVCLSAKRKQGTPLGASRCFFRKRFIPTPLPLTQKEKGDRFFFLQSRGEPRISASSTRAAAGHYCPPYSRARAPRSGRESVRAYAHDLKIRSKL